MATMKKRLPFIEFRPDWFVLRTVKGAEDAMSDFKFRGPGWYLGKRDTVLVIPQGPVKHLWKQRGWLKTQRFLFLVYNDRNPCESFNAVANAPVREDTR